MAYIMGTDNPETLVGLDNENDALLGFGGDDHLIGLGGHDQLFGHGGADLLEGGLGDDIYQLFDDTTDTIIDIGGFDYIRTEIGRDLADYPDIEGIYQILSYGGRPLYGNDLNNELNDEDGGNRLDGRDGNDRLIAGGGNDLLIGGNGVDELFGQAGSDRFDFRTVGEIGLGEGSRDIIWDFAPGGDRIMLGAIDAQESRTGNQAFSFIGADGFTGAAGELRWEWDTKSDGSSVTLIEGDTNGDGMADFELELRGQITLTAEDFIL